MSFSKNSDLRIISSQDIALSNIADQDVLSYSTSLRKWQNKPATSTTIDAVTADIQPLGTQAAGSIGKAADAGHVHPTTGLALATNGGAENIVNVGSASGNVTLNLSNGNIFNVTLSGDVTFTFTGVSTGHAASFSLFLSQNSSGNHNVNWPGGVKWPGGTRPTLTLAANAIDLVVFESLNGTTWFGGLAGANYS